MSCDHTNLRLPRGCSQAASARFSRLRPILAVLLPALLILAVGCSDEAGQAKSDGGNGSLWPCSKPGLACNAHDPCAINPICGQDGLCYPEKFQNCDDGLACTVDSCGTLGECINEPVPTACVLLVKDPNGPSNLRCFASGDQKPGEPCRSCDPEQDPKAWSRSSGGSCDDGNSCTIKDTCREGVCEGEYYGNFCSDNLGCTDDLCDGLGGCSNALKSDYCLINNVCVKDQQKNASGCLRCDVSVDRYAWTALSGLCQIDGFCFEPGTRDSTSCGVCEPARDLQRWSPAQDRCYIDSSCYRPGESDPTRCGVCAPDQSTSSWTITDTCLILGSCYAAAATSPSGCGLCAPQQATTRWTPVAGSATLHSASFESGLGGYSADPAVEGVGWQTSSQRAHGGSTSLYFGNPAGGSYAASAASAGSVTTPAFSLPAGQRAGLQLWLYLDVETSPSHDLLTLSVGQLPLWTKSDQTLPAASYRRWVPLDVDLTAFAGQSISLTFRFDSVDSWANDGEGVYIDDVTVLTGCGSQGL